MALKTFVVTVSNPGSGNRYFIDGVQQDTLELVYGQTYRFDQSDASNATHPLRISATSDGTHGGGTEYTTNVTTYGTPGSAGAYTEIDPVAGDAPRPLFYYCSNHSGMGGQMDPSGDTWGALNWGDGEWGDQGNVEVSVTSAGQISTTNFNSVINFEALADAQLSSDQSKFGNTSLELDGSGDRIQSGDITLGTDSYTWETFAYFNNFSSTQCIWDAGENVGASQNPVVFITSTNLQLSYAGGTYINAAHGMSADTWHHIAIVRDGTQLEAFIDGTSIGTATYAGGAGTTNHVLGGNFAGTFTMDGYLDESRLTRRAVYTGNFTPPTQAFTNDDSDDIWLLHYDGPDGSTVILNSAEEKLTVTGNADVSVDGLSLTPVIDSPFVTSNFEVGVGGLVMSMDQGDVVQTGAGTVAITVTFGLNTEVGQETEAYPRQGWGRDGWGVAAWGIDADEVVEVAGFTVASAIGSATASIDVAVTVDSQATIGTLIGNEDAFTDVTVSVDGQDMTTAQGDAVGFTSITIEQVGFSLTGETGQSEAGLLTEVQVTGATATFAQPGEVVVTDSIAKLTGISMSVVVDANHRISAWKQVDTGEQVTWSVVDQAA